MRACFHDFRNCPLYNREGHRIKRNDHITCRKCTRLCAPDSPAQNDSTQTLNKPPTAIRTELSRAEERNPSAEILHAKLGSSSSASSVATMCDATAADADAAAGVACIVANRHFTRTEARGDEAFPQSVRLRVRVCVCELVSERTRLLTFPHGAQDAQGACTEFERAHFAHCGSAHGAF